MNTQAHIQALGPLAPLYNDPEIVEIMVDAYDKVIVDRKGKLVNAGVKFESDEALRTTYPTNPKNTLNATTKPMICPGCLIKYE